MFELKFSKNCCRWMEQLSLYPKFENDGTDMRYLILDWCGPKSNQVDKNAPVGCVTTHMYVLHCGWVTFLGGRYGCTGCREISTGVIVDNFSSFIVFIIMTRQI